MSTKTNNTELSTAERRAVRSHKVVIVNAEPFGWLAMSEGGTDVYQLYCHPDTRRLICTCGDFVFRGDADDEHECKHIVAALKHIAITYLTHEYDSRLQNRRGDLRELTTF